MRGQHPVQTAKSSQEIESFFYFSNQAFYKHLNNKPFSDYQRIDFSALYDVKLSSKYRVKSLKLGCSFLNIYNRKNILGRTFFLVDVEDENGEFFTQIYEITRFSLEFTPNFVARLGF